MSYIEAGPRTIKVLHMVWLSLSFGESGMVHRNVFCEQTRLLLPGLCVLISSTSLSTSLDPSGW